MSTDTGALREGLEYQVFTAIQETSWARGVAMLDSDVAAFRTAILALPALRDLIAERDQAIAAIERVRAVADGQAGAAGLPVLRGDRFDAGVAAAYRDSAERIRRALDGPS